MRTMTTLIAVVGPRAEQVVEALVERSTNLTSESPGPPADDPVQCATHLNAVWRRAARHGSVFTAVAADPLTAVVREWAQRLRGDDHELETVIGLTGELPTPDYWLVDDRLPEPEIHWYAGHLASVARRRVILIRLDPGSLAVQIASLPTGPQPAPITEIAQGARGYVPSQGLAAGNPSEAAILVEPERVLRR
jgi:hypothetical protein